MRCVPHLLIVAVLACTALEARAVSATAVNRDAAAGFCDRTLQAQARCQGTGLTADQPR